jgi:hypothetical protein
MGTIAVMNPSGPLFVTPPVEIPSYLVWANGAGWWVPQNELRDDDLVQSTDGSWRPANTFAEFAGMFGQPAVQPPERDHPLVTIGKVLLASAAAVSVGVVTYKFVQAMTDEDFGTTEFPAWFRRELIDEHVARTGWYCTGCDCTVSKGWACRNGANIPFLASRGGGSGSRR